VSEDTDAAIARMARDIQEMRSMLTQVLNAIAEAESEIPEKMRRFVMYFHDIHDIVAVHESRGHQAPQYLKREMERCDDRFRHLVEDAHGDQGAFERVRQDMTQRTGNRWDHSRLLPKETPQ
jgi:hypothetical protein